MTQQKFITWDFFLSYPKSEESLAEALYELMSPKHSVFMDKKSILPGNDWDTDISAALDQSLITVVLVSDRTPVAHYQRAEIVKSIDLTRQDPKRHRVVPVILGDPFESHTCLPLGLEIKQAIFANSVGGLAGVVAELQRVLSALDTKESAILANIVSQPEEDEPSALFKSALFKEDLSEGDGRITWSIRLSATNSLMLRIEFYGDYEVASWPSNCPPTKVYKAFCATASKSLPADTLVNITAVGLDGRQRRDSRELAKLGSESLFTSDLALLRLDVSGISFIAEVFAPDSDAALWCGVIAKSLDVAMLQGFIEATYACLLPTRAIWARVINILRERRGTTK